jgi:PPOX class probable F420-dependent enzyme
MDISEFAKYRYMSLATFRKNGAEVKTPVWFAVLDGKIYCYTAGKSGKVKRLRNSSRARVAPSDVRGNPLGDWRDTNARIIADPALAERSFAALQAKYGWQVSILTFFARVAGAIKDRVYIEVDY